MNTTETIRSEFDDHLESIRCAIALCNSAVDLGGSVDDNSARFLNSKLAVMFDFLIDSGYCGNGQSLFLSRYCANKQMIFRVNSYEIGEKYEYVMWSITPNSNSSEWQMVRYDVRNNSKRTIRLNVHA